ncbi:hypothetical protein FRACYDRAFT_240882 [Fragilariopsis cylindrus CCMP1102]|uniref:Uncharacterized protein n=1 Tax=Fragilariopsis cylindrus CCMP1102 TaxID=635003 RepID=A0A1E7F8K3_9STRA|nr:hypothetical protein FRACYDRAFT_240882 [Fragilariopsis cylindrus CCMP1102]|eukprot:OEU14345.1 hypothetical protein FRACYDRAFT_240882 [Fragilariopsis cylindrus CCMP1102]
MAIKKSAGATEAALLQWFTLLFVSRIVVVVLIDGFVFVSNSNSNSNSNYNSMKLRTRTQPLSKSKSKLLHQTDDENNNSSPYYPQQQQQQNTEDNDNKDDDIIRIMKKLRNATKQIEPFWITLNINNNCNNGTGTFGTSRRGVLWLYPFSSSSFRRRPSVTKDDGDKDNDNENKNDLLVEPIIALQSLLEKEFPICSESLKSNGRTFIPHMTVSSNFNSLNDAKDAQRKIITNNTTTPPLSSILSFWCQEIYLLERIGDNGQFMKRMTIPLGCRNKKDDDDQKINGSVTNSVNNVIVNDDDDDVNDNLGNDSSSIMMQYQYHDPLLKFIDMPLIEEDWIYKERMGLKLKRKINNKNNMRDDDDNDNDGSESESAPTTKIIRRRRKKLSRSNTRSKRIRRSERNRKMKSKMNIPSPTKEEMEQKRFERKARRRNKTSM